MKVLAPSAAAAPTPLAAVQPAWEPAVETMLVGISWGTYIRLRDETDAAGQVLYITYDRGMMLLTSPVQPHERLKKILGRMVETTSLELAIPVASAGSTTWRREDRAAGLEAYEAYYVQNERRIRGKRVIDLMIDPPPDLALEPESDHGGLDRLAVYARLGVPEVWRYDCQRLSAVVLRDVGGRHEYVPTEFSAAFPFLRPADLMPFLARAFDAGETALMLEFRDWVVANLKPNS